MVLILLAVSNNERLKCNSKRELYYSFNPFNSNMLIGQGPSWYCKIYDVHCILKIKCFNLVITIYKLECCGKLAGKRTNPVIGLF